MKEQSDTALLEAKQLEVGYHHNLILKQLSIAIPAGGVTALVGTNGSGKSTLLKTIARLLIPHKGGVYLDGQAIARESTIALARKMAILPQSPEIPMAMTVRELVEQGRYPHVGPLRMLKKQDHTAIKEALELTGMHAFAGRPLDALSGGERQRAWIALALAQSTPLLMLDEPTTFLDVRHQLEILELVRRLNQERGITIIVVLHDLNQAARYADRMVVLKDGVIEVDGPPDRVLTETMLQEVFGIHATVLNDPVTGTPVFLPHSIA